MTQEPLQPIPEPTRTNIWILVAAWVMVGIPLAWGIYKTVEKALVLFR